MPRIVIFWDVLWWKFGVVINWNMYVHYTFYYHFPIYAKYFYFVGRKETLPAIRLIKQLLEMNGFLKSRVTYFRSISGRFTMRETWDLNVDKQSVSGQVKEDSSEATRCEILSDWAGLDLTGIITPNNFEAPLVTPLPAKQRISFLIAVEHAFSYTYTSLSTEWCF